MNLFAESVVQSGGAARRAARARGLSACVEPLIAGNDAARAAPPGPHPRRARAAARPARSAAALAPSNKRATFRLAHTPVPQYY